MREQLQAVSQALSSLPREELEPIFPYVLFPLTTLLQLFTEVTQSSSSTINWQATGADVVRELLLTCLEKLLAKSQFTRDHFLKVFGLILRVFDLQNQLNASNKVTLRSECTYNF